MKTIIIIVIIITLVGLLWFWRFLYLPALDEIGNPDLYTAVPTASFNQENKQNNMKLESSTFEHNKFISSQYTCDGQDINPPLLISEIPTKAESLAIIMDDPDAIKPAGKVWDHWVVFNIPIPENGVLEISENSEPEGVHGIGTSRNTKYHGPCPPDGEHRYFFKVYALDTTLDLAEGATKSDVERAMDEHIIEQAELVGKYKRI